MKDIAEKYSKMWRLLILSMIKDKIISDYRVVVVDSMKGFTLGEFTQRYFGYLVLEFFPKHGIHIESRYDWKMNRSTWFVYEKIFLDAYTFSTPQDALIKASKILEKQLNNKEEVLK